MFEMYESSTYTVRLAHYTLLESIGMRRMELHDDCALLQAASTALHSTLYISVGLAANETM